MYWPTNFNHKEEKKYRILTEKLIDFIKTNPNFPLDYNHIIRTILTNNKITTQTFPAKWKINLIIWRDYPRLWSTKLGQKLSFLLTKTKIRSLSGIIPLSVFTKGRGCPYHCVYCPTAGNQNIPKSYFPDEAAVQRALRFNFDPYKQVEGRLVMFLLSGHNIDKVDLIIQGGTFSFYNKDYRRWFVKRCFDAANSSIIDYVKTGQRKTSLSRTLEEAQKKNQTAKSRIIGITIETRPDYINPDEIKFLRLLGVTRVELGVQIVDDKILKLVKRGHGTEEIKKTTYLLKEAGFKVTYHLMPNLPGSNPQKDLEKLREIFFNPNYRPDNIKIYPTALVKGAELWEWYKNGRYKPYDKEKLIKILINFKEKIVPEYVRIQRLVRDLTKNDQKKVLVESHLRQKLNRAKIKCNCIRCREIRNQPQENIWLKILAYKASQGIEYFLSFVDKNNRLYGLLRLRINHQSKKWPAIIRELHVYGKAIALEKFEQEASQHKGLGKQLIKEAERITKQLGFKKLAIISGIGVRPYYQKLNYHLEDTYMVKDLK